MMVQAFQHVVRSLLRTPTFTAVSVLTLSLGIGGSTAIYALLERVVLDPLPYPNADRLVRLKSQVPGVAPGTEWNLSAAEFFHFGQQVQTLEEIAAYRLISSTVQTPAGPARVRLAFVSASALPLLGASTTSGRVLGKADDEPGGRLIAMISHAFWQRQFGADPKVVGRTLQMFAQPVEIVGVMAPNIELPDEPGMPTTIQTDVWMPMRLDPAGPFANDHSISMIARLKPGVNVAQAESELQHLTAQLPDLFPNVYSAGFFERYGFRTAAYPLKEYTVGQIARNLWLLFGAVGLVLLTGCANIANLFLVRLEGRRRELAIRTTLGASRGAIARLFFTESLLVALVGALVALFLSSWGIRLLVSVAPPTIPRLGNVGLDASVVAFTFAIALATAAVLTLLSLIRQERGTGMGGLMEGGPSATIGRQRQRMRSALIVGQVTLALTLIVGAVLLVDSFRRLRAEDTGIRPEGVLTMELAAPPADYRGHDQLWMFYKQVLDRIRALPEVASAGLSTALPFTGGYGCTVQGFEDTSVYDRLRSSDVTTCATQQQTTPGFFEALGIPLLRGRPFNDRDNDNPATGAVIVSRAFAERFWPGEDAVGKGVGPNGHSKAPFYRVVGVVGDVFAESVDNEKAIAIYYPITRIPDTPGWSPPYTVKLVVSTTGADPASVFPAIRRAVNEVNSSVPLANAEEMQVLVDRSMSRVSFVMVLVGVSAAVALFLAAIGLYVVVSYLVARRTHEIGIRIALGAQRAQVEYLVVSRSFVPVLAGLVLGTLVALFLARLLRGLLFGVDSTNPAAYAAAVALLATVAIVASWIPARRAARMDPNIALKAG
jgi:putative ABC transport system permease protein